MKTEPWRFSYEPGAFPWTAKRGQWWYGKGNHFIASTKWGIKHEVRRQMRREAKAERMAEKINAELAGLTEELNPPAPKPPTYGTDPENHYEGR